MSMTGNAEPAPAAGNAPASEVARLEQELAQLRAEFQDFVYTVSHDLRAPLRHITAFTQVIAEDLPQAPPDILGHLATIRQSAQLLAQQLDGLTALSRLGQQRLQLQPVAVVPLVQAVVDELMLRQPARQVQWHLAQDVPPLWADPDLLRQVFMHLLDNALKFSRGNEVSVISLTWQQLAGKPPGQSSRCDIQLRDNGVGFAPERADKLFKVFGKLHLPREFEGLGLGLVSCRKIMQRLGGDIHIEAALRQGCCVTLSLPLAA